jgi:hypothetical protein
VPLIGFCPAGHGASSRGGEPQQSTGNISKQQQQPLPAGEITQSRALLLAGTCCMSLAGMPLNKLAGCCHHCLQEHGNAGCIAGPQRSGASHCSMRKQHLQRTCCATVCIIHVYCTHVMGVGDNSSAYCWLLTAVQLCAGVNLLARQAPCEPPAGSSSSSSAVSDRVYGCMYYCIYSCTSCHACGDTLPATCARPAGSSSSST